MISYEEFKRMFDMLAREQQVDFISLMLELAKSEEFKTALEKKQAQL